jgi:hypothetical protein
MISGLKTAGLALLALLTVLAWTPIRVEASGGEHCQKTGSMPASDHQPAGQPDCGSPCDSGTCPQGPCVSVTAQLASLKDVMDAPALPVPANGFGFRLHLHGSSPPPTPPPNSLLG